MNKEAIFTHLWELKDFLNKLSDDELNASTNEADWFEIYVTSSKYPETGGRYYYHIQPKDGGVE